LRIAEAAPQGDGVDVAFVKAQAAADAFVLVDHVASARLSVNGVDRAIFDALAAPVAFDVDIDLGPGLDKVDETIGRTFVDRHDEIFLAGIIERLASCPAMLDGAGRGRT
jgi:hypothetical protein